MLIFTNRAFIRFVHKERIEDSQICDAVRRAEQGLIDADLGGGVIKQRIARPGQGKSGGYRTIILYRSESRAFFVYGFAKNERQNIDITQLRDLRQLADVLLKCSDQQLEAVVSTDGWREVKYSE